MRTLWLARHGQSLSNAVRRFQGTQDIALSDLGRRQAVALSAGLRGRTVAHVYASPLERAHETAAIIGQALGLPVQVRDDLTESALAARWDALRLDVIEAAALRVPRPVPALAVAARGAPSWVSAPGGKGGRDFGSLVHRLLEWTPFDAASRAGLQAMAEALAPSLGGFGRKAERAAEAAWRALALPVMARARASARIWRELRLWFPEGEELVEGVVDLVFEEEGELVVVDYKTDSIAPQQALAQAAHHAPQLQLYGRGLVQATGMKLRERVVLFTTTGQAVLV